MTRAGSPTLHLMPMFASGSAGAANRPTDRGVTTAGAPAATALSPVGHGLDSVAVSTAGTAVGAHGVVLAHVAPAPLSGSPAGNGGTAAAGGAGGAGSAPAIGLVLWFVLLAVLAGQKLLPGDAAVPPEPLRLLSSRPD